MSGSTLRAPRPLFVVGVCAGATALAFLPSMATVAVRSVTRDLAGPGAFAAGRVARTLSALRARVLDRGDLEQRVVELESKLAEERLRSRAAEAKAANVLASRPSEDESPALVVPDLLTARVLGSEAEAAWRAGRLVDVGLGDDVREDAVVLATEGPIVDQGRDGNLDVGHTVLAGRTIVGRIRVVGRWTSIVEPITADEFRMQVRLAHETSRGLAFGPSGILRGTGTDRCRLDFVASTEAVEEGDAVYAVATDSVDDFGPLYLGVVVRAELPAGSPHWELEVEPAAPRALERVSILRRRLSPRRLLTN